MAYLPNQYLQGITSATTFVIPAGYMIRNIVIYNNTGNAITGGLKVGTTLGGTDVVTSIAVNASSIVNVADSSIAKRFFSKTSDTTIYIDAVVSWNSANVDIFIPCSKIN